MTNEEPQSFPEQLRKREEYMIKASVQESIEAMYGTFFSLAYSEINRIEDQFPWFDEPNQKGMLDFDFFYHFAIEGIKHMMKDKEIEQKAAIADLIINDMSEIMGFDDVENVLKSLVPLKPCCSCLEKQDNSSISTQKE